MTQRDPLDDITALTLQIREYETQIRQYVALARSRATSWQRIADALGTTKQGAWEKYRGVDKFRG